MASSGNIPKTSPLLPARAPIVNTGGILTPALGHVDAS
jgi:hypothetical protein